MNASELDSMFSSAYRAACDGDGNEALVICDRILAQAPDHHNTQMLKACLLGDSPVAANRVQARQIFRSALRLTGVRREDAEWPEENPVHQLAISFQKSAESRAAVAAYTIDYILNRTPGSRTELLALLADEPEAVATVSEMLDLAVAPQPGS